MQKAIKWFKNYWYYYKWRVLIIAFVLLVVVFCTAQCAMREKFDIYITYAGPDAIGSQIDDIRSAIKQTYTSPELKNSKGISVRDIVWVNKEIAAQYQREDIYYDPAANNNNQKLLYNEAASGDSFIYILDKYQYERLREDGVFASLKDALGYMPDTAYDEYGIDFKSTEFAKYFDCFKDLRGDLVLCIRSKELSRSFINQIKGGSEYEKSYELHRKLFSDLVNFKLS